MNQDVVQSRLQVSRRRALGLGGTIGLGGLLAACGVGRDDSVDSAAPPATSTTGAPLASSPAATDDVIAMLDRAGTCSMAVEETQGPYWFDVDSIRSDLREDRPGTTLQLAVRVHDTSGCAAGGAVAAVPNSVVEIWHCDAGGVYSGFESGSLGGGGAAPGGPGGGGPGGGGPPTDGADGSAGETSDGSYSSGDVEASTTDDGTYLRGAQVADANGVVQFTTVYPGWYRGRTVHIHLKVHVDRATVLTTQLYFDESVNDEVFATAPYDEHTGRDTTNNDDSIFDATGLVTAEATSDGYLAVINLGIDV